MSPKQIQHAVDILNVFAREDYTDLVSVISDNPKSTVASIKTFLPLTGAKLRYRLNTLIYLGIVVKEKSHKTTVYRVNSFKYWELLDKVNNSVTKFNTYPL